jgi:hypothetical protein
MVIRIHPLDEVGRLATLDPLHLSADLVLGQGLAPVHVPAVQHQPDAPQAQRERRPEEVSARERPDPDQEGVHHQIDEQVHAEVALLPEPGDRPVAQVLARDRQLLVGHLDHLPDQPPTSEQPHMRTSWFLRTGHRLAGASLATAGRHFMAARTW